MENLWKNPKKPFKKTVETCEKLEKQFKHENQQLKNELANL